MDRTGCGFGGWLGCCAGLLLAVAASADQLDQQYRPAEVGATVTMSESFDRAQTFTVGTSGTLTSVHLLIAANFATLPGDVLTIDVRPTDAGGVPVESDGAALGSVTLVGSQLDDTLDTYTELDFTPFAIPVTAGDRLAIVARSDAPFLGGRAFAWGGNLVDQGGYPGGTAWVRSSTWALQNGGGVDLAFETWVEAPEPGAACAASTATAALLAWVRLGARRRRVATRSAP